MKKTSFLLVSGAITSTLIISASVFAATTKAPAKPTTPAPVVAPVAIKPTAPTTAPVTTIKETIVNNFITDSKISLLRNYLKLRDEIIDKTLGVGDANGDCGIYVSFWNNYYLPQINAIRNIAKRQKLDYLLYISANDMTSIKNYLGTLKKGCLIGYKDTDTYTQPSLSSFDKTQIETYRALLLEDFGFYTSYIMPQVSYYTECQSFANEDWKYILKPRFDNYISIAQSLRFNDEIEYFNAYKKAASSLSKSICDKTLD